MVAYSSTDEARTSDDEENIEQRHQNLVAGSPNTPRRRAERRQAVLMPEVELCFIQSQRGKSLAIHEGDFFCFTFKDAENTCHWRCTKYSKGCKMVLETNENRQCVGISDGQHNHVAALQLRYDDSSKISSWV